MATMYLYNDKKQALAIVTFWSLNETLTFVEKGKFTILPRLKIRFFCNWFIAST